MKMIKNYYLLILLFSLLFFLGCSTTVPVPTNQAPTINSNPITSTLVGESYTYDVEATDADGDTLIYSLTSSPSGMTIDSATGVINWSPFMFGNYNVGIEASDGDLCDTQSYTLSVKLSMTELKLSPPTGVTASDGNTGTINIYWDEVSGASHYQVYRASSLMGTRVSISGWNPQNYYLDDNVIPGTTYWYWVKAATSDSGANDSGYSDYDTGYCKSMWEF